MAVQSGTEFHIDSIRCMRKQVRTQSTEHDLENGNSQESDGEHVERRQALVRKNLVDHDLEKQRSDQREQLQNKRRDQHLAEQTSVLVERGDEPRQIEPAA